MTSRSKYRFGDFRNQLIGLSLSYQRENLLARGMGIEHLRELMIQLARPLVRRGASLAFGGHWKNTEENFTFDLLRLVSEEQEDNSAADSDTERRIGTLYNHSAWPRYLAVTPSIEAQWINSCRIVRIDQSLAEIPAADQVQDEKIEGEKNRVLLNSAICLSAMRRFGMDGLHLRVPDLPDPETETVPQIYARIMLGGEVETFKGFLPGLFEEALVTLERKRPLFMLGGFGGAAEVLAKAMLIKGVKGRPARRPDQLKLDWLMQRNENLKELAALAEKRGLPAGTRSSKDALDALYGFVTQARKNLGATLKNGLNYQQNKELMTTRDMSMAVRLVRDGLKLAELPE